MADSAPSMLKATLIGGLVCGALGAVPVVNCLNVLCCALVVGGGFFAALMYSRTCRSAGVAFRPGNGAMVGLVAGLFYTIGNTVVGLLFQPSADDIAQTLEQLESAGLPPEAVERAAQFAEIFASSIGWILQFCITLLIAAVFSTIGGLIGGALFKVEAAPPAAPPSIGGGTGPSPS